MMRNDLNYARGLAILMIVIGHTNGIHPLVDKLIYSLHVPLFFVISGILLHHNRTAERRWDTILKGWLHRIVIPMAIWETILSVSYVFMKDIPIPELLKNSLTLNFNLSVMWFLPCTLAAQALWMLFLKLCKGDPNNMVCLAVMLLSSFIAQVIGILFVKRILVALVFIGFGYVTDRVLRFEEDRKYLQMIRLLTGVLIWIPAFLVNERADLSAGVLGNPLLYYLHSAAGSLAIIVGCGMVKRELPLLRWIGSNSFGILVTHVFVRHAVILVEEKLLGQFYGGWSLALLIVVIDLFVVWMIGTIAPELFGNKRKSKQVR